MNGTDCYCWFWKRWYGFVSNSHGFLVSFFSFSLLLSFPWLFYNWEKKETNKQKKAKQRNNVKLFWEKLKGFKYLHFERKVANIFLLLCVMFRSTSSMQEKQNLVGFLVDYNCFLPIWPVCQIYDLYLSFEDRVAQLHRKQWLLLFNVEKSGS